MSDPTMKCRGNEGGGMRTVECLRGRLLAERVASKAAKEEADQLANRLDELGKKLSDEVKVRNKAERRLRRAIKKLESLKILDVELSESSIGSLSSNGCSGHQAPETTEERNRPGSLCTVDSPRTGPHGGEAKGWDGGDGDSAAGSSAGSCTQVNSSSQDGSWFSVASEQSGSGPGKEVNRMDPDNGKNCGSGEGAGNADHDFEREQQPAASNGSTKSETSYRDGNADRLALVLVDHPRHDAEAGGARTDQHDARAAELRAAETNEEEQEERDRLAIVLADPQPRPDAAAKTRSGSSNDVESVLLALRQVKEQLRYTIERRSPGLVAHRELYGH